MKRNDYYIQVIERRGHQGLIDAVTADRIDLFWASQLAKRASDAGIDEAIRPWTREEHKPRLKSNATFTRVKDHVYNDNRYMFISTQNEGWKPEIPLVECKCGHCGTKFKAIRATRKFCSNACRQAHYRVLR
jgi:hypothetical protein